MNGIGLERALLAGRRAGRTELIFFLNAGDPTPGLGFELLRVLAGHGVAAVELCVPFPRSLSDGESIRASHRRALANGATLTTALALAARARMELGLAICLLADYGHTVAPLGLPRFLEACRDAGAAATLVHALPPQHRREYVERSQGLGLGRIMSFFVGSTAAVRQAAYREGEGFLYVVSRFGRTGQKVRFDGTLIEQIAEIRAETKKPLAVGFGVKTAEDIRSLRRAGADAVIIGSAATAVVERYLATPGQIPTAFDALVLGLRSACTPGADNARPGH